MTFPSFSFLLTSIPSFFPTSAHSNTNSLSPSTPFSPPSSVVSSPQWVYFTHNPLFLTMKSNAKPLLHNKLQQACSLPLRLLRHKHQPLKSTSARLPNLPETFRKEHHDGVKFSLTPATTAAAAAAATLKPQTSPSAAHPTLHRQEAQGLIHTISHSPHTKPHTPLLTATSQPFSSPKDKNKPLNRKHRARPLQVECRCPTQLSASSAAKLDCQKIHHLHVARCMPWPT